MQLLSPSTRHGGIARGQPPITFQWKKRPLPHHENPKRKALLDKCFVQIPCSRLALLGGVSSSLLWPRHLRFFCAHASACDLPPSALVLEAMCLWSLPGGTNLGFGCLFYALRVFGCFSTCEKRPGAFPPIKETTWGVSSKARNAGRCRGNCFFPFRKVYTGKFIA